MALAFKAESFIWPELTWFGDSQRNSLRLVTSNFVTTLSNKISPKLEEVVERKFVLFGLSLSLIIRGADISGSLNTIVLLLTSQLMFTKGNEIFTFSWTMTLDKFKHCLASHKLNKFKSGDRERKIGFRSSCLKSSKYLKALPSKAKNYLQFC